MKLRRALSFAIAATAVLAAGCGPCGGPATPAPPPVVDPADANCTTPRPNAEATCVQDCGPPVAREGDPPPAWRWLTPEEVTAREQGGCPRCLPPDAVIATPAGDVAVHDLVAGAPGLVPRRSGPARRRPGGPRRPGGHAAVARARRRRAVRRPDGPRLPRPPDGRWPYGRRRSFWTWACPSYGLDFTREFRKTSNAPIIMLTARSDESDKLIGLELGADDYKTKPFSPKELVARDRVVFRRIENATNAGSEIIRYGDLVLDVPRMRVTAMKREIEELTPTEFELLATLARQPGRVFTRAQILDAIHGVAFESYMNARLTPTSKISAVRSKSKLVSRSM